MPYTLVGLGNPGKEYDGTRHNIGRAIVQSFAGRVKILIPDTFMNDTGKFVWKYIKSKNAAEKLIVVHDDLDLPIGSFKISFGRGSGGHRGVESVIKFLKTENFIRVRTGITPATPSGKLKKPSGGKKVISYILGKFTAAEVKVLKKLTPKIHDAIEKIVSVGLDAAMNEYN